MKFLAGEWLISAESDIETIEEIIGFYGCGWALPTLVRLRVHNARGVQVPFR